MAEQKRQREREKKTAFVINFINKTIKLRNVLEGKNNKMKLTEIQRGK